MSYGLEVVNNFGSVSISSEHKVLVFSERGTFRIRSEYTDRVGHGEVVFSKVITTVEAPQVFVRYESGVHNDLGLYSRLQGGPGNWTGFKVVSAVRGNPNLQNYLMEYVSCKFADQQASNSYGLNIWDYMGRPVFSSSDRVVRYNKFAKAWTLAIGNYVDVFSSNLVIDADDFICLSAFDWGPAWFTDFSNNSGLTLMENGVRTLKIHNQKTGAGGYWYWQGTNGTNFCIPVCKFPLSRYYN